jgi:membrane protease YdiL (CAAX protease family)
MSEEAPAERPLRAWHVFAVYVWAIASIIATTWVALGLLAAADPDVAPEALLQSLAGLLAASVGASGGFLLALALALRPADPIALRLAPGRETGAVLAVATLGLLALGQALDSLAFLAGLGEQGSLPTIRRLVEGAQGPALFGALLVLGVLSPAVEEIFFRGFMQPRLAILWGPAPAVLVTSVCFAALHLDIAGPHMALAFVLSLYLGFVAHLTGSTLPAIVCHVINNTAFVLLTALRLTPTDREVNTALVVGGAVAFLGCLAWLRRTPPA